MEMQKAGGIASLFIALAYLAAIPYFVIFVNYSSVVDPIQKVILLRDNFTSMLMMHTVSFEFAALGMIVLILAVYKRLKGLAPSIAQLATIVGLIRVGLLLASVMIFNYGTETVVQLYATSTGQAVSAWQAIEPVAQALGGSGGELLGGVWILLSSVAALRAKEFPRVLNWLGVVIGSAGILSAMPVLVGLEAVFELLQIVWFFWLGIVMLRTKAVVI